MKSLTRMSSLLIILVLAGAPCGVDSGFAPAKYARIEQTISPVALDELGDWSDQQAK